MRGRAQALNNMGLIHRGNGELDRALTVKANKFSGAARSKIEAAGGKVEEI